MCTLFNATIACSTYMANILAHKYVCVDACSKWGLNGKGAECYCVKSECRRKADWNCNYRKKLILNLLITKTWNENGVVSRSKRSIAYNWPKRQKESLNWNNWTWSLWISRRLRINFLRFNSPWHLTWKWINLWLIIRRDEMVRWWKSI